MNNKNTVTLSEKEKQQQQAEQAKDFSDETIYNLNEENSVLAAGGCGVCERKGFPIFLVRKTIIAKNFANQTWSTNVKSLGDREPQVDLVSQEWTYRTLRKGFVYILVKRTKPKANESKNYQYLFYEVTPSGTLRHTTVKQPIEKNVREIPDSCIKDGHHYKGLFANIDTSVYSGVAYVAYSRRAWSRKTLKTYREAANSGNAELLARFSKIDISDKSKQDPTQLSIDTIPRSFSFKDFDKGTNLLEFKINEHFTLDYNGNKELGLINNKETAGVSSLRQFLKSLNANLDDLHHLVWPQSNQKYFTAHQFNSLQHSKVKAEIGDNNKQMQMSVLVVEDPMAVAEELAFHRKMKLQPISQALIESEMVSQQKASEIYKNLLGENKANAAEIDYDEQFDEIVKKHETTPVKYQHWAKNIDGSKFDYFDEKSIHLRKIIQYIDSFEVQTKSHLASTAAQLIIYKYDYERTNNRVPLLHTVIKNQNDEEMTSKDSHNYIMRYDAKKRELTELDKKKLELEQQRIDNKWGKNTYKVRLKVFPIKDLDTDYKEKEKKEWIDKYEKQLDLTKKTTATDKMKTDYEQVVNFIKKHSVDYYTYLTWLWGGKKRAETVIERAKKQQENQQEIEILPKLSKYNEVEFWLEEWDTNGSNSHIGSLCDLVNILDDCQIGNIKIPYQFAVWDLLLVNNTSIYYHMIHGLNGDLVTLKNEQANDNGKQATSDKIASKSWWDLLLEVRLELDKLTPEQYQQLKQQYLTQKTEANGVSLESESITNDDKEITEKRGIALSKLINDYKHELNDLFFVEKGLVLLQLFDVLIMRMTSAVGQRDKTKDFIDYSVWNQHLEQAAMVLDGQSMIKLKIDNVPAKDVSELLDLFYGIEGYRIQPSSSDEDDNVLTSVFISTIMPTSYDLYEKISPVLTVKGVSNFGDFFTKIAANLRNETTGTGVFACDFSRAKLDAASVTFDGRGKFYLEGGGLTIKAIAAIGSYQSMNETMAKLSEFGLGENKIREISNQLSLAITNVAASFTSLACASIELLYKGSLGFSNATFLRVASCSIAKGAFGIVKVAGATAGIIGGVAGVIEGVVSFQAAWIKYQKGGQHAMLYMVGAGFQILSGALSVFGSLGLLACFGPIGGILLLVAMIGLIVTALLQCWYNDESDDWNPMQNWLSRCAFGKQNHPDKGQPYPVTYDGMAFLNNDYVIARMGLTANIMLNDEDYLTYDIPNSKQAIENMAEYRYNHPATDLSSVRKPNQTFEEYKKAYIEYELSQRKGNKAIYLTMKLAKQLDNQPDNDFEGTLLLDYGNNNVLKEVVKFSKSDKQKIGVNLSSDKPLKYFGMRPSKILLNDKVDSTIQEQAKVDLEEFVNNRKDKETGEYFGVNFKLGELTSYRFKCYLRCKYWINGRVDKRTGKTNPPVLLHYKHLK